MSISVSRVQWEQAAQLLKAVREKVFVCEWRIPKSIEFDKDDIHAFHMLVCDDNTQEPIATGRISPNGEISRIAVLPKHRQLGLDKIVLLGLIKIAGELNLQEVYVSIPLISVDSFRSQGFSTIGAVYMEAGIPRQRMACQLENVSMAKYYLSH